MVPGSGKCHIDSLSICGEGTCMGYGSGQKYDVLLHALHDIKQQYCSWESLAYSSCMSELAEQDPAMFGRCTLLRWILLLISHCDQMQIEDTSEVHRVRKPQKMALCD